MDRHRVSERCMRRWIILNESRLCQMRQCGWFEINSGEDRYPIIETLSDRGELLVKRVSELLSLAVHGESDSFGDRSS